ncbi:MAG TPA: hypothetical protein VKH18_09515 [Terriglobales bacterium]|nr:hypothetical protein [Terriglobales bacterium]
MKVNLGKFIASATLCLLLASCAQTGPPLPPSLELPKPPSDLRASRKGNRVTLSWSEPTLTTDRQSVRYIGPTLVCRGPDPEITECGNPAAMLPAPPDLPQKRGSRHSTAQKSGSPRPAPLTYTDTLPVATQQQDPLAEVTYAVEVLNRNARGEGLSNRVHVPAVATLPPPTDLAAELTGDGAVLTWTGAGESQNVPLLQLRYRIYRRDENSGKDTIAGEVPIGEPGPTHFTDSSFEWEGTYLYRITAVSIIKRPDSEVQVEGDDTPQVRVIAHDVFPPAVPAGLQAAYSGEGQKPFVDLIWAPVTTADLAGYNVYRSEIETGSADNQKPVKLNSELVKSPSYRDSAVASGKTYTYSVSAVDVRGNESRRSEETSEPVP